MSSRRRPYLNLKESITSLFRTTARWLKDTTDKESIFEKPYDQPEYRAMHLKIPTPDWPIDNPGGIPPRPKTWTYVWDPGICGLGTASPQCGEEFTIPVSIGLLPPGTIVKSFEVSATSSNAECIKILRVESSLGEAGGSIRCKATDQCTDTVTICAQAKLIGEVRDTLEVEVPPAFERGGVLDYRQAANLPALVDTYKKTGFTYNCGCIDITLDCCGIGSISYDSENSSATILASGTGTAAITDSGDSAPYTWEISGTGFYFDAGHARTKIETGAKSVGIFTSGACGVGLITITDCLGNTANGAIRCTTGRWIQDSLCSNPSCGFIGSCGSLSPMDSNYICYYAAYCQYFTCPTGCGSGTTCWGHDGTRANCTYAVCCARLSEQCHWGCAGDPGINCQNAGGCSPP